MNSCKTKKQLDDVCNYMQNQHYKHVAENGVLPHNNTTRSTYIFGQNDTNNGQYHTRNLHMKEDNNTISDL